MIITYQSQNDQIACIAWGWLNSDPVRIEVGANCTPKTSFFFRMRSVKKGEQEYNLDSAKVECWRGVADLAARLEKRDYVCILGHLEEDSYWTEKKGETCFKIIADMVIPQSALEMISQGAFTNQVPTFNDTQLNPDEIFGMTDPDYTTSI